MNLEREELMLASALGGLMILLFVVRMVGRRDHLPCLILTEFRMSNTLQHGCYAVIAGRPEGLWAWFLSLFGMGTDVRFEVQKSCAQLEMEHWNSHIIDSVPIQNLASTSFGSTKKIIYLVLAAVLVFAGLAGIATATLLKIKPLNGGIPAVAISITCGLAGLIFFVCYFLSKRLVIQIETAGGRFIGVRFKPSIIGHLTVNIEEASKVIQIVNSLIARGSNG